MHYWRGEWAWKVKGEGEGRGGGGDVLVAAGQEKLVGEIQVLFYRVELSLYSSGSGR